MYLQQNTVINFSNIYKVCFEKEEIVLDEELLCSIEKQYQQFETADKRIYGINSGFGALGFLLESIDAKMHQKNLLYHLATGVGKPYEPQLVKAMMFCRLVTLIKGYSLVSTKLLNGLLLLINQNIIPQVPSIGTVGASGDLTPLAHIALALIGEGTLNNGKHLNNTNAAEFFANNSQIAPLKLQKRDALAFVNGTSAMTAIAAINAYRSAQLLQLAVQLGCLYAELLGARIEYFNPHLSSARNQPAQIKLAEIMYQQLISSHFINKQLIADDSVDLYGNKVLQHAYTIRCIPQILGAIFNTITWHNNTVNNELNAVTDNPIFMPNNVSVYHGGNFMGSFIANVSDALSNAIVQLSVLVERQIARITDESLNKGRFPVYLIHQAKGVNSGFMGAQVTATALVAHMRSYCMPASIQSIPTNNNNQDVVSMGTIAAYKTYELIENAFNVLTIATIVFTEAADFLKKESSTKQFSPYAESLYLLCRKEIAPVLKDRILSNDINLLKQSLQQQLPLFQ
ncbi:MAG: HAL/PAL/TAL family ammonia-lyase [Chitinophagaceae bacterium]